MSKLANSLTVVIAWATLTIVANSAPPSQPTFQYILCNFEYETYSDDPYEANLRGVLSTLKQQASMSARFYSTSLGSHPDAVHGQYYCRRDIPSDLCSNCIEEAALQALSTCGLATSGVVWYQECTLRYSNHFMYGILDNLDEPHPYSIAYSSAYVSSDPELFSFALNETMTALIEEAVLSRDLFATGEGKMSQVYSLVQCSPDLNAMQCDTCLRYLYGDMWTCCGRWPASVYALYPSCQMMYNADNAFYYSGESKAPPPGLMSTPPPFVKSPSPSKSLPPSSSLAAPSPSTISQPPSSMSQPPSLLPKGAPSPAKISQPPPAPNGVVTTIRKNSIKVKIMTTMILLFIVEINP